MKLVSVILPRGADTRLWPVSRQARPTPFMRLSGATLLQHAVERSQACDAEKLVVVTHPDPLLVAHKTAARKIATVADLRARKYGSARMLSEVPRSRKTYSSRKESNSYKVTGITAKPSEAISTLHHHQHLDAWGVVEGVAIGQIDNEKRTALAGEHCYIPLKEKYRLTDIVTDEFVLIDAQRSRHQGEAGILRLADTYGRK